MGGKEPCLIDPTCRPFDRPPEHVSNPLINGSSKETIMNILAIGQPCDPSISCWPEGCHYNYDISGHLLHYLFSNPSTIEVSSVQRGKARFGLYIQGPVIFLLHQFGEMLWNDAPYSWWLVSQETRKLPEVGDHLHALLKVVLVDSTSGLVAALRALTFSSAFTNRLHEAIRAQSEHHWSQSEHDSVIREVYSRFSTEDLLRRAIITCNGGD
jgi:hypothetical protein